MFQCKALYRKRVLQHVELFALQSLYEEMLRHNVYILRKSEIHRHRSHVAKRLLEVIEDVSVSKDFRHLLTGTIFFVMVLFVVGQQIKHISVIAFFAGKCFVFIAPAVLHGVGRTVAVEIKPNSIFRIAKRQRCTVGTVLHSANNVPFVYVKRKYLHSQNICRIIFCRYAAISVTIMDW